MGKMKTSFIATVFNEEENIRVFLDSITRQTVMPDEIVIVDGGSTDKTLSVISNFSYPVSEIDIKILKKRGNRSIGRNLAIERSSGDIIICSDAGCVLDVNFIKNITKPFVHNDFDVVSGNYRGKADNIFQKCLIPYVLVMPDKINSNNFLPSARSIAFKKEVWERVGGFDNKLSLNEDYAFAIKLKKNKAKMFFEKNAIVCWIPRKSFKEAFIMFFKFARGDMEAGVIRPKVILVFLRYIIGIFLLVWNIKILLILLILYSAWAVAKNYKYVRDVRALYILPFLQFTADIAVLSGTTRGLLK